MSLYPYQEIAVEDIRGYYAKGVKKVLLHLATGGGKTHVFSHIIKNAVEKGTQCMMVVRGRQLVEQASRRLEREGVDHGVIMAGHWRARPLYPVQVCSIDTLYRRKLIPRAKLIVIDEAHMATSEGYTWLATQLPEAYFLGVTATPYVKKSLKHIADVVVHPITVLELIQQGFLVPPIHYAPSSPNLKGVRTVSNDYDPEQLEERMNVLTGDIVTHWKSHALDRPTICFAVNIRHSHSLMEQFKLQGISCEHMDANTPDKEREAVFERMKRGETKVVCNVGILGVGVDLPFVSCIIMARPTKSYNLYIQQAGRGTRTYPGKTDFILLDHAGNAKRHGIITDEKNVSLDGKFTGKAPKTCKRCFIVYDSTYCPDCGPTEAEERAEREIKQMMIKDEKLIKISDLKIPMEMQIKNYINDLKIIQKERGYKRGWIYFKVKDKFGETVADKYFPKRELPWFIQQKLGKTGE